MLSTRDGTGGNPKGVRNLLIVVVVLLVAASVGALTFSHNRPNPIVEVNGSALEATFCTTSAPAVTSGAEFLKNRSAGPVTVSAAKAVHTTNAQLVDTAIVPVTSTDAVARGPGLPTSAAPPPAGLTAAAWARRRYVPSAIIPPARTDPTVKAWQLVFGVKVRDPGRRATLQQVVVTFHQGNRIYHFVSQLHDVIEAAGISAAHC